MSFREKLLNGSVIALVLTGTLVCLPALVVPTAAEIGRAHV